MPIIVLNSYFRSVRVSRRIISSGHDVPISHPEPLARQHLTRARSVALLVLGLPARSALASLPTQGLEVIEQVLAVVLVIAGHVDDGREAEMLSGPGYPLHAGVDIAGQHDDVLISLWRRPVGEFEMQVGGCGFSFAFPRHHDLAIKVHDSMQADAIGGEAKGRSVVPVRV